MAGKTTYKQSRNIFQNVFLIEIAHILIYTVICYEKMCISSKIMRTCFIDKKIIELENNLIDNINQFLRSKWFEIYSTI